MKRYLFLLLFAALLLSAASCTTPRYVSRQSDMELTWIGRPHSDIVRTFGAPSREVSDGAKGVILVYEEFYTDYETDQWGSIGREHRNYTEFFLNEDGLCYDLRTNQVLQDGRQFNFLGTFGLLLASIATILLLVAN
ncbi:MAG: hypothetical protein IJU74_06790 [Bacteroidales bacterium]|nr:hypothetical protein [Bacteroidales bacterium]MBQ7610788.1 hypothetical protein [Bacteroidales bacterium]MBR6868814.1 hypothetical protein [Bacteroidales bacterium]